MLLDMIVSGRKTFEGRTKDKIKDWNLRVGMQIVFYDKENPSNSVLCEVSRLMCFPTFVDAYQTLGDSLIPDSDPVSVVDLYNRIYKYDTETLEAGKTSQKIKDLGVVAIGLVVMTADNQSLHC
jgi:ASC-1-like (ASCH) protein